VATLIEVIIVIGVISLLGTGFFLTTTVQLNRLQDQIAADYFESALYLSHAESQAHRVDSWITVANAIPTATFSLPPLGIPSDLTINGTGKLGFKDTGITKYAGTLTIGNSRRVSLGINRGRPYADILR